MFGFLKELLNPEMLGKTQSSSGESEREARIKAMQQRAEGVVTPERAELLRKAMEIRRAKQVIFDDLNDEQRQKLVAIALKKLLNEGRDGEK